MSWEADLWASTEQNRGQLSRRKETGADYAEGPAQENVALRSSHRSGSLQKRKRRKKQPTLFLIRGLHSTEEN